MNKAIIIGVTALLLSSCTNNMNSNEQVGTTLGAVGGALLGAGLGGGGAQVITGAAGALVGAVIGYEIGRHLDKSDQVAAQSAYYQATTNNLHEKAHWHNIQTGHSGEVTPISDRVTMQGMYCRDFKSRIYIDNRPKTVVGTACRRPNGTWKRID